MFNSRDIDPLMRDKEHAGRSQPLRGFAHRRAPPERTHSDGLFTAGIPGLWGRSFSGHDSSHRYGGDFPDSWRSMSPGNTRDFGPTAPTTSQQRSGAYQDHQFRITFEQAITNMMAALDHANEGLQKLDTTFSKDIASLKLWLPTQHVDSLWTIYTAWNGIPATTAKNHPANLKADGCKTASRSATPTPTYADITARICKALTGLRRCSPPEELALGDQYLAEPELVSRFSPSNSGGGLGWHVLRTTMRKLEISLEAIEELIMLVKMHRDRMPALRHEVQAALQLLEGLRPVLNDKAKKSKTTTTARETTGTGTGRRRNDFDEEYDWPNYGSI